MAVIQGWQVVASLAEFGDFDDITGGEKSQNQTDYTPAGSRTATKLEGTYAVGDITLSRAFDPVRDLPVVDYFNKYMRGKEQPRTIVKKYLDAQGVDTGRRTSYSPCKPKSVKVPDGKSGDNAPAMFSITFGVEDHT